MPRSGKGQKAYSNRTDLMTQTVPSEEYGKRAEQQASQQAMPMGGTPQPVQAAAPMSENQMVQTPQQQQQYVPGNMRWLHPTDRPDEPIQHGLPSGPGAGPEALGAAPNLVSNTLAIMAHADQASPLLRDLAAAARASGV